MLLDPTKSKDIKHLDSVLAFLKVDKSEKGCLKRKVVRQIKELNTLENRYLKSERGISRHASH